MNKDIKSQWVDALRSGKYTQGRGALRDKNDHFCCLGVLSELAAEAGVVEASQISKRNGWNYIDVTGPATYSYTQIIGAVAQWAGMDEVERVFCNQTLASDNDSGMSFDDIADKIEQEL